jgi:hypothetical protein
MATDNVTGKIGLVYGDRSGTRLGGCRFGRLWHQNYV